MDTLEKYGLSEKDIVQGGIGPGECCGRVIYQSHRLYRVITEKGEIYAEVSGKYQFDATGALDFPVVGDFVVVSETEGHSGNSTIRRRLPRKSAFERRAAGSDRETQIIAANIDVIFICMAFGPDYNLRRLERYLSIAWDSGAEPVVVMTKSDLCEDIASSLLEIQAAAGTCSVICTTKSEPQTADRLTDFLLPNKSGAFIGSSGVGKSTLINLILGGEIQATKGVRDSDSRGRHTTTSRELFLLPMGGMLIDTPGMREIGVSSADFSKSFEDIDDLALLCRFSDCKHESEPGCEVQTAISDGRLSFERLQNYFKLKKEAVYSGKNSRQIEEEKIKSMFGSYGGIKNAQKYLREKNKRRGL